MNLANLTLDSNSITTHQSSTPFNRDVTGLSKDGGSICHDRWERDGERNVEILDGKCLDGEFQKINNDALSLSYIQWIPYILVIQVIQCRKV